jgi:hypothetical protein
MQHLKKNYILVPSVRGAKKLRFRLSNTGSKSKKDRSFLAVLKEIEQKSAKFHPLLLFFYPYS